MRLDIKQIKQAKKNISSLVRTTDLMYDYNSSVKFDSKVYLKLENTQVVRSFKLRGAMNAICQLTPQQKKKGVITASAGNHGQGVALSATQLGVKSIIVVPNSTPKIKVDAIIGFGGEVVFGPTNFFDDANTLALKMAKEKNLSYISPYDDVNVMAGQGTIGVEILQQNPQIDLVICPIGGGGLIAGLSTAIKALKPKCEVIGVQVENFPDARDLFKGDKLSTINKYLPSIADGISVKYPSKDAISIMKKHVKDIVTVSNEEIADAILYLAEKNKQVVEGAGATAFAAVLSGKVNIKNKHVAIIISGGNIDFVRFIHTLYKSLEAAKRKITFSYFHSQKDFTNLLKASQSVSGSMVLPGDIPLTEQTKNYLIKGWNKVVLFIHDNESKDNFFKILKDQKIKFKL